MLSSVIANKLLIRPAVDEDPGCELPVSDEGLVDLRAIAAGDGYVTAAEISVTYGPSLVPRSGLDGKIAISWLPEMGPPDAHASTHENGGSDEIDLAAIPGNITAAQHGDLPTGDPHAQYALDADLAAHEGAPDPHPAYQRESEKGAALGYASLDANTKVPIAQLPAFAGTLGAITGGSITVNTAGVSVNLPAYLTTAGLSGATSNYAGINGAITGGSLTVNTSGVSINLPAYLTTAQPVGAYLTTARASNDAVGLATALTANGVAWTVNSAGLSLNVPAYLTTAQPVGAYLTTAGLSADSSKYAATGFTTTTVAGAVVAGTHDTLGLKLAVPAFLTTAQAPGAYLTTAMLSNAATISNVRVSAGTASTYLSAFTFADDGGVSFGLDGSVFTASAPAGGGGAGTGFTTTTIAGAVVAGTLTTDGLLLAVPAYLTTAQSPGAYLTTAALSAGTSNYAGVGETVGTIAGTDLAMTVNTDGVSVGYAKWITTAALSANTSNYAGINGAITGGSITVNTSGVSVNLPAYLTTAALSNHSHGNPTLNLTNLSGTTASASNGLTISLSAAAPGGAGNPMSWFANMDEYQGAASTVMQISASTIWVHPFVLPKDISVSFIRMPIVMSHVTTVTAGTAANRTMSNERYRTDAVVVYSQGVGASSRSIQSVASGSAGWTMQTVHVNGTAGSQWTASLKITYPQLGFNTGVFTTSYGGSTSNYAVSSLLMTLFTGTKWLDIPFATSLSAGNYWLGFGRSTGSSVGAVTGLVLASFGFSCYGISQAASSFALVGAVSSASDHQLYPALGFWTTNSNVFSTASIAMSQVSQVANNPMPYFQMIRSA